MADIDVGVMDFLYDNDLIIFDEEDLKILNFEEHRAGEWLSLSSCHIVGRYLIIRMLVSCLCF